MPGILGCKPFVQKNMSQVGSTVGTNDLSALAVCIRHPLNSTLDLIVKGRPSAMRFKLILPKVIPFLKKKKTASQTR